jgi:stage II sporulation protein D
MPIQKAVNDSRDMVVTYNGALADTVFSRLQGGRTEDAVNVWGNSVPYLKSVRTNMSQVIPIIQ